ncbi:MAG: YjbH domain-containing protein [Candidatus Hodarchaeota archaeon]
MKSFFTVQNKILVLLLFCFATSYKAQNLAGITGLYYIPTARVNSDGQFDFGASYFAKKAIDYSNINRNVYVIYSKIGYLSFLEVAVRLTAVYDSYEPNHSADRMISFKIRLLNENYYLPVVSVGMQSLFATDNEARLFNSTYIVLTKSFQTNTIIKNVELTLGYGIDIIKSRDYDYIGLFGGISLSPWNWSEIMLEFDAERWNGGVRVTLLEHIKVLAGLIEYKYFSGGVSVSWNLL